MPLRLFSREYTGILKILFILCVFLNKLSIFAQIQVTMPVERAVYQRVNNVASIYIGGNILVTADQIQARLIPKLGGQAVDWKTIDANIGKGTFLGELSYITGGWYQLEVRAMVSGIQVGPISTVSKVGVGEVFIVSGQSNAQGGRPPMGGFFDNSSYGSTDDRVNCINLIDENPLSFPKYPKISQLIANTEIAPQGHTAWCWGMLGDKIVKELNVPVLFFNCGVGGTRIRQWQNSAKGEQVYDYYSNIIPPMGWPYIHLKKSLNYYGSIFGVRAVLWQQGEDDAAINTNFLDYKSDLEQLITKSREHFGKNISWVVSKTSRSKFGVNDNIRMAQQSVIDNIGFNVFQGPETDNIQPSTSLRDDGVHFHGTGLIELANEWSKYIINETFLLNSTPTLANKPFQIDILSCVDKNFVNLSISPNFKNPVWIWNNDINFQETYNRTIVPFDENYALVKEKNNYLLSPKYTFTPPDLEIKLAQQPKICEGQNLTLLAITPNNNYNWSTGAKTSTISISKVGNYTISLSSTDIYGCNSKAESSFNLQVINLPTTPIIEPQSALNFCEGGKVLIIDKNNLNYGKLWNTNTTNKAIEVNKSGTYNLQNIDDYGCKSEKSNDVTVVVNPLPIQPKITTEGKDKFCSGDSLKIITSPASEYIWKSENGEFRNKSQELFVKNAGNYTLRVVSEYGCESVESLSLLIKKLPLPDAPFIQNQGKSAFCAGDSTTIFTSTIAPIYSWYSGNGNIEVGNTSKLRLISQIKDLAFEKRYYLTISDNNNCISPKSNIVIVTVKQIPQKPQINQIGPFTLVATTLNENISKFYWQLNGTMLKQTEKEIKINQTGNYAVKLEQKYLIGNNSLFCYSDYSTALELNLIKDELIIYPNPVTNGILYFETLEDVSNLNYKVFTLLGFEIASQSNINTGNRNQINLINLRGYYILEFNLNGKYIRKTIFIGN